jgi:DNA polymerase-4
MESVRRIIHIDMDCFYASVETKYNPHYKGKPLAVGGPPESRSVLCTANYEARRFGVKAAIPSRRAVKLCPQLILVPPQFDLYREESLAIRKIFEKFTDKIEPLSLDEAYLDVSECRDFKGSATLIAREIRQQIFENRKLTASAGIAPNKFLAKVASDWKKPNNQFTISPDLIEEFMPELPVDCIYGIGKVTAKRLEEKGIRNCRNLQALSTYDLKKLFGSRAQEMFELCRGIDHREVITSWERKSLTVEETFSQDLQDILQIRAELPSLYETWSQRMDKGNYWERMAGWVVKLKFFDFKSTTHEISNRSKPTLQDFLNLVDNAFERQKKPVRLIGLGCRLKESLSDQETQQQSLFI